MFIGDDELAQCVDVRQRVQRHLDRVVGVVREGERGVLTLTGGKKGVERV